MAGPTMIGSQLAINIITPIIAPRPPAANDEDAAALNCRSACGALCSESVFVNTCFVREKTSRKGLAKSIPPKEAPTTRTKANGLEKPSSGAWWDIVKMSTAQMKKNEEMIL